MDSKEVTLSWEGHHRTMISVFEKLLERSSLVDCTIVAEGRQRKAHKEVLLAFSPYFQIIMPEESEKNPTIILSGFTFQELSALIDYMYYGKVVIPEDRVENLIDAAQSLQIRGLGGNQDTSSESKKGSDSLPRPVQSSVAHKLRKRNNSEACASLLSMETEEGIKRRTQIVSQTLQPKNDSSLQLNKSGAGIRLSSDVISGSTCSDLSVTENEFEIIPKTEEVDVYKNSMITAESNEGKTTVLCFSTDFSMGNERNLHESVPLVQDSSQMSNLPPAVPLSSIVTSLVSGGNILALSSNEQSRNMIPFSSGASLIPCTSTGEELSSELRLKVEPVDEHLSEETMEEITGTEEFGGEMETEEYEQNHGVGAATTEESWNRYQQLGNASQNSSDSNDCATASTAVAAVHVGIHSGVKRFKCSVCDFATAHSGSLTNHRRIHTTDKPYKCSDCDFATAQLRNLKIHRHIHTGEKPFKCSHCDFASAHSRSLTVHRRIHTREKPYKCSNCAFASAQLVSLKVHRLIHCGEKT